MEKRIGNRSMGKLAAAAAVGLAGFGAAQHVDASLIIDVRATGVNGAPLGAGSTAKDVTAGRGDTVTFAIFAVLTGTNGANDETVASAHGALISTPGNLLGNLSANVVAPFNGNGSQNGLVQDLDSDTDLDVGSGPNGGVNTHFFLARSNTQENGTITSAQSEEIQIGTANFVVGEQGLETFVNFFRRASASGGNINTAATWFEDGAIRAPSNGVYGTGAPVRVIVPEPTGLALAGLTGLGLLARRRNKNA